MGKFLGIFIAIAIATLIATPSLMAADTDAESFNVTVSIAEDAGISISGGSIDFGQMSVGSEATSDSPVTVTNDGSGSNQTYSLNLTNPSGWTAVTAEPAIDQYRLQAAFDADGTLTWTPANHALTTAAVTSTGTKFAGSETADTGAGVVYAATRKLWLRLKTPSKTASTSEKTIAVTITATVD